MKIVPKLSLAYFLATCAVLGVNGYLRVRREVSSFEEDRSRDHEMIGRAVAVAAGTVGRVEGETAALSLVSAVDRHFERIHIRWLEGDQSALPISAATLDAQPIGEPLSRVVRDPEGDSYLHTYVPVDLGSRRAALEFTDPAPIERRFERRVLIDTGGTALALALLGAVLAFVLGEVLLGRPVRRLQENVRRIARGDFSEPLTIARRDELGSLGLEVNAMRARLSVTLDQLRHADRLATVGTLASGVAHELGTPLNVVMARASMIARGETPEDEIKRDAGIIGEATQRMTKIIRQLLQFARRTGPQKAPEDAREIARRTLELLLPLASKRGVSLTLAPGDGSDTVLPLDAGQVQQVITNLVMNAVQASPAGTGVEVAIDACEAPRTEEATCGECVRIRVRDDGVGIAAEHLPHVFEPFYTTKDVGEGTGLGLPVAYGIVRDHGGWIDITSAPGAGSVFTVMLPRTIDR